MATLDESLGDPRDTQLHDALALGVDTLGQNQTVAFTPYVRTVLPLDGFIFWLNASLLSAEKLAQHGLQTAEAIEVGGSLHYASIGHMVEDETIAVRRVDFTAKEQITAFAEIAPDVMYVAEWTVPNFGSFKFTFSQRSSFYEQAGIYHYVGDAVYPAFADQLIDNIDAFDQRQVVSNSLPLWLAMMQQVPPFQAVTSGVPLYPAFMVPPNLAPPYGAVEIPESSTRGVASTPWRGRDNTRAQLVTERVRITFYGLRNDEVMDFVDYSLDYTLNTGAFGIMNVPVVQDGHRSQIELAALAQKKVVEYEISYLQTRSRDIARQLIESATIVMFPADTPIVPLPPTIVPGFPG